MTYTRYAIYYIAPEGPFAEAGAQWLGWDVIAGAASAQPSVPSLQDITQTPAKYGFHATLKPPFRLAEGTTETALAKDFNALASRLPPARADGLSLSRIGRFLALTLRGSDADISALAASCVTELDGHRAPPSAPELARRRKAGLSAAQEQHLIRWGYPYVLDAFQFHITLTGRLNDAQIDTWHAHATAHFGPLPTPFAVDQIALVGERQDGRFELISRAALGG